MHNKYQSLYNEVLTPLVLLNSQYLLNGGNMNAALVVEAKNRLIQVCTENHLTPTFTRDGEDILVAIRESTGALIVAVVLNLQNYESYKGEEDE